MVKMRSQNQRAPRRPKPKALHVKGGFQVEQDWHWIYNLIPIGLVVGALSAAFLIPKFLVSPWVILRVVIGVLLVGMVLPLRVYRKQFAMGPWAVVLLNFLGIGPLVLALIGWSNYWITGPVQTQVISIQAVEEVSQADFLESPYFVVTDGSPIEKEFPRLKVFDPIDWVEDCTHVRTSWAEGWTGAKVLLDRSLVIESSPR